MIKIMLFIINFLIYICLVNSSPIAKTSNYKIKKILIVTLNGARTPGTYFLDDKNKAYWDKYGGFSQQTPLGKEQMVALGKFLKNYYSDFLTQDYYPKNVYVRSIDTDRSLSSASALLYGMYHDSSNSTEELWSKSSDWVPISIHTYNKKMDPIFTVTAQPCPRYEYIKMISLESQNYLQIERTKKNFIQAMSEYSGLQLNRYIDVWKVAENILCQIHHNFTLDDFAIANIDEIRDVFFYTSNFLYAETIEKSKLIAGPLLHDIIIRIICRISNKSSDCAKLDGKADEVTIYSLGKAHAQFYGLIGLLKLAQVPVRPFLASSYIFELIEKDSEFYIRVQYKTNDVGHPITITPVRIENCSELCPISKLLSITVDRAVKNTKKACAYKKF